MDDIPDGMTMDQEWQYIRRAQYHERKNPTVDYLAGLRPWVMKADLTFPTMAAPERAEKCVRAWLRAVAAGCWAVVGYERQDRGAVHAHVVLDVELEKHQAAATWNMKAGFCRIARIRSGGAAVRYAVKHAVKDGDFDIYEPGGISKLLTTGVQRRLVNVPDGPTPNNRRGPTATHSPPR